jgi:hypothetical protein
MAGHTPPQETIGFTEQSAVWTVIRVSLSLLFFDRTIALLCRAASRRGRTACG